MTRALRHVKTGEILPMHEHMAKHPDLEFVTLDEAGKVVEPEETGPAAEVPKEEPKPEPPRKPQRNRKKDTYEPSTRGDDLDLGDE